MDDNADQFDSSVDQESGDSSTIAAPRRFSMLWLGFWVFLFAALTPIALKGWQALYSGFLEQAPPEIQLDEAPRGVGIAPVKVRFKLNDLGTGLRDVAVTADQRGRKRELLRQSFSGEKQANIELEFPGLKSKLDEGTVTIEIKAFDRSFWSNTGRFELMLSVDYRKPKVEVLSTQHNAVQGGSQVIFYRAFDEDLSTSGVKVGSKTFEGFPARHVDSAFTDPSLYVAIYSVPHDTKLSQNQIKVFAEDRVGNAVSTSFYNKIKQRPPRTLDIKLTEQFLRERVSSLADQNFVELENLAQKSGRILKYQTQRGSISRLREQFRLVNENLRRYNQSQVLSLLQSPRFDKLWEGSFVKPFGSLEVPFGVLMRYSFNGRKLGQQYQEGYKIRTSHRAKVHAANGGVVIFSDHLGVYGRMVAMDHGLGLVSLYGRLGEVTVSEGDQVSKGAHIAYAGQTGFATSPQVYFEMRVQGVPVNPREWLDRAWVDAHVDGKINEVKKLLGITRYIPLR